MQLSWKPLSTIEAVFSVGSVQRSYLTNIRRYGSVLSFEFWVEARSSSTCEDLVCD
jgi:hypothetical protein